MSDTDLQLLARYTRHKDEDAFAAIVRRHLNLVYSAALRQVRSPQLAEEIAQSAFIDLARNAHRLASSTILTAWLYQVASRTAIDVVRRESRRQLREQIATEMNAMNATADDWEQIEPLLDEAMQTLNDTDRAAVLLRYFENKSLREVGDSLGTTDDTAQKRVSRAVERLREFFIKRGVTIGASGLAAAVSANAVQAAPVGLATTISTAAATLAGTSIAATATATATKAIAMTTLQKTIVTATVAVLAGAGIHEARQASNARAEAETLRQKQAPLNEQIQQLTRERNEAMGKLASLQTENERLNRNTSELPKLRGQGGSLRQELAETKSRSAASVEQTNTAANAWPPGNYKWVDDWKDVGLDTPEAAVATYWWALAKSNVIRLNECMAFDPAFPSGATTNIDSSRLARSYSGSFRTGNIKGIGLYSAKQTGESLQSTLPSRAEIEVNVMEVNSESPPTSDGRVTFKPVKIVHELIQLDGKWKILLPPPGSNVHLEFDDDPEVVAKALMMVPAEKVEELKSKSLIPEKTFRLYEAMKAQGKK